MNFDDNGKQKESKQGCARSMLTGLKQREKKREGDSDSQLPVPCRTVADATQICLAATYQHEEATMADGDSTVVLSGLVKM